MQPRKGVFHESATFMDYLHGDVPPAEAWFACRYEYARESPQLCHEAEKRDEVLARLRCRRRRSGRVFNYDEAALAFFRRRPNGWDTPDMPVISFLCCESFPSNDWNELSKSERIRIIQYHDTPAVRPLSVPHLPLMRRKFREVAGAELPRGQSDVPGLPPRAILCKGGSVYWCLFTVDFSEAPKLLRQRFTAFLQTSQISQLWRKHKKQRTKLSGRPLRVSKAQRQTRSKPAYYWCLCELDLSARKGDLVSQFKKWLATPENMKRLERCARQKRGTTGGALDRLKDLAAWRLCREITQQSKAWLHANDYANGNRKRFQTWEEVRSTCKPVKGKWPYEPGDVRPFRDAKSTKRGLANQADLFSDQSEASDAKRNAMDFLTDLFHSEFKKSYSPDG